MADDGGGGDSGGGDLSSGILSAEGTGQNPNSSAAGPGQFINSTWLNLINTYAPDLAQGKSQSEILGMRTDPQYAPLAQQMVQQYAQDNQAFLANKGLPVTPGSTYLAHFLGPQGAANVLGADPNAPAAVGNTVMSANPFLQGMTNGQVAQWAEGKMAAPALPPATNVGLPPQITPQQPNPMLPGAQPQQQQQQLPGQPKKPPDPPPPNLDPPMLPMLLPPKFQPKDLSQYLQQAMANLPATLRGYSFSGNQ